MSFDIYECYVAEDSSIQRKLIARSDTPYDCFCILYERGHKIHGVRIHNGFNQTETISPKRTKKDCDLIYFEYKNPKKTINVEEGSRFYVIQNTEDAKSTYAFSLFCKQHQACSCHINKKWSRWRKALLHPGNFLTIAFLCVAVGLILTAFFPPIGLVAAPFLAFFAVGFTAVSAISAIGYAIDWLKREYNAYETEEAANDRQASFLSLSFIKHCFVELKDWAKDHPVQTTLMVIGALLLLGALAVTAGYFIAPTLFGFMALGAAGGAIGLTTSFFSTGFSIAASGGLLSVLASTFAGAALISGSTHILDTIRRVGSGLFKDNSNENTYFIADGEGSSRRRSVIHVENYSPVDDPQIDSQIKKLRDEIEKNAGTEIDFGDTKELEDFLDEKEEPEFESKWETLGSIFYG